MAEEFKTYLDTVDAQVRWKRARPALRRELRTHLEEQKADCMAAGMREADAEAEAVRQMGDAQTVGQALDAVHRPKKQMLLLIPAALLAVLGAVLRVGYEGREAAMTLASLALTAAVLVGGYLFDYRWLGRHAWFIYGVGLTEWVLLAPMELLSGWFMVGSVSGYLALLFPVLYAPVVYALRGRADGLALSLAALLPFAVLLHKDPFALAWMGFGAGAAVVLLTAIRFGLFPVKKRAAYACVCAALAFWIVYFYIVRYVRDHATWYLDPAQITEWSQAICEVPLLERTAVRSLLPFAGTGTAGALWLGALALVVCGMLAGLCARAFRLHNPLGRMLAMAAAALFAVRGVGAALDLLGICPFYAPLPFVDGNLFSVADAGLLGLALSGLRQSACPEMRLTDFSGSAKCRTAPAERT